MTARQQAVNVGTNFMKTILFIVFSLICVISFGQKTTNDFLLSFSDSSSGHELYGFKTISGKVVIKPRYEMIATDTMYKIAFVTLKYKWLAIDRHGKIILTPYIFDNGPDYVEEGLFRYEENGKMGFANLQGQKVIKATFDFVEPFKRGLAAFNIGGHRERFDDEHWTWSGGLWGFINKKGNVEIKPRFTKTYGFENKFAEAWTQDKKHILIDKKGNTQQILTK